MAQSLLLKASYIFVAHNHPSDNVNPSQADISLTKQLYNSCEMIGIPLLDHIIICKTSYFSFKKQCMLK